MIHTARHRTCNCTKCKNAIYKLEKRYFTLHERMSIVRARIYFLTCLWMIVAIFTAAFTIDDDAENWYRALMFFALMTPILLVTILTLKRAPGGG